MVQKVKGEASPKIGDVLANVAAHHRQLNKLDTELSAEIKRVETALRKHFSVRVWTDITCDADNEHGYQSILAFGKSEGRWQLLVDSGPVHDADSWSSQSLLSCTRDMRARVFLEGHVERLVNEASAQIEKECTDRMLAVGIAHSLANALEEVPA